MGVRYVLQSERMGHEVPGMRGVYATSRPGYGPVSEGIRTPDIQDHNLAL